MNRIQRFFDPRQAAYRPTSDWEGLWRPLHIYDFIPDRMRKAWLVKQQPHMSELEAMVRQTFGDISIEGWTSHIDGQGRLRVQLEETTIQNVYVDGHRHFAEGSYWTSGCDFDREQCVRDAVGTMASTCWRLNKYGRDDIEGVIVVRKKGDACSAFYTSVHVDAEDGSYPENTVITASDASSYSRPMHFAITPVSRQKSQWYASLGL